MIDFPQSLLEFQQRFGDEAACAQYLAAARWPDGFVCPNCGGSKAWRLETKAWTYECANCGRQTSITAGTIMHHSKLPLTAWFWAAYLMATHSNGISALQLQRQLAIGSYKTAWLQCAKLRRSMLAPRRSPLAGLVEVDERAFEHVTHTQFLPDPLYVDVLALIREGRIARGEPANARKGGDDLLDHSVGKIFLFRVTAEIVERQDRKRRLVRAPCRIFAAQNLTPSPLLYTSMRWFPNALRGIDSFVFALLFVAAVGLGPFAGVLGVGLHSAGTIAKLWSEAIEAVEPGPLEAAALTGANRLKVISYALLPDVLPNLTSIALYVWEFNVRASTVLGVVGAGGIGQELKNSVDLLDFARLLTIILLILAMVTVIDQFSAWLRRRLV